MDAQPRILIVEDDKGLNHLMQKKLRREGLGTEGALYGKEALSKIHLNSNMLMLLDYSLPDMDGVQLINELREKKCEIPFIVITGWGNEEIAVEMMKLGAKEYLIKDSGLLDMLPVIVSNVMKDIEIEKKLMEVEMMLQETSYLNQIILDRMPCVTFLLQPHTRKILAANASAVTVGAVPGKKCYETWGKRDDPCPWCKAPILWESGEEQRCTYEASGTTWDAYWVPVDDNMYMHYVFDTSICKPDDTSSS
jgi:ActR/RegA family two-component response regulator